jgi:ketosteroid isomerase-like protein
MRIIRQFCAGLVAAILAVSAACAADPDVQAIEKTYRAWVAVTNARDITRWSSFLAEDPYFSPADSTPLTSREAVLAYYERSFADPLFSLDCEQLDVRVSDSRDMAWSRGVCAATFTLPDGTKGHGSSRWLKVWTKYPDDSWKCRVNSWKSEN